MNSHTANFYDKFSFFYPLVDKFLTPQKRILFREINNLSPGKLLDVGIGNASHSSHYAKHSVVGIDTSEKMLARAKKNNSNITLRKMDGASLQFDSESFDYIVMSHVISVVDNPGKLLDESHRVLRHAGKLFILNHFTPQNPLRYVDRSFQWFSRSLHFRSVFYSNSITQNNQFNVIKEISLDPFSYFKLLILEKA